ncbi:plasmid pRiA4b ORF-3 family protein [Bacillus pinisoli]|uniref:plasmid pRiA4b ORF-3 family protein n=1 Tax=Bacillus pinisoli TaxID=2901866 RepID=UPI001FF2D2A3|nr:plasmid pRiA4b ORF-3 family protein [Bacillus pinisoli]
MLIQCTKKLLTELKIKPEPTMEQEPLFSWHANMLTINRRKTLVLMNDRSRYVIVLYGLKAKDLKNVEALILQAIKETFQSEGIKDEVIEGYLSRLGQATYTTTKDRTMVARLNEACKNVTFFEEDINQNVMNQAHMNRRLSRLLVGNGKNDYTQPNEDLYQALEELTGEPIFDTNAYVLQVKLQLSNHHVWRKVIVPKHITFPELHQTLQTVFGWEDSHLHEFIVFEPTSNGKPRINLVCHEEALHFQTGIPMKLDTEEKLTDYLPAVIIYHYDFGDSWRHEITVESVIDNYDKNYPTCIAGEGNTPPEDVGGEMGYEEFLAIISDPSHPDHVHMKNWGEDQGYEEFDIKSVNRWLK